MKAAAKKDQIGKNTKTGHSKSQESLTKSGRNNDLGVTKKTSTTDGGSKTDKSRRK